MSTTHQGPPAAESATFPDGNWPPNIVSLTARSANTLCAVLLKSKVREGLCITHVLPRVCLQDGKWRGTKDVNRRSRPGSKEVIPRISNRGGQPWPMMMATIRVGAHNRIMGVHVTLGNLVLFESIN